MAIITNNLDTLISIIVILLITFIVALIAKMWINKTIGVVKCRTASGCTKLTMLRHIITGAIWCIGILIAICTIPALRTFSTTLLAGAGLAVMVLGLAAQTTFSNMVSGIVLVFFRPFDIGDNITVDGNYGEVIDMDLRQTTIKTFDNKRIIIPNSSLNSTTIENHTANNDKTFIGTVTIGISYDSDIERAREIMINEARKSKFVMKSEEVAKLHGEGELPDVKARVIELGPSSVDLRLDFWLYSRSDLFDAQTSIREAVKKQFDAEPNVSIPFPHQTILFGNEIKMAEKKN